MRSLGLVALASFAALFVGSVAIGAPPPKRALMPQQAAAKETFDKRMQAPLDEARRVCGVDFTFTTDFENFDPNVYYAGVPDSDKQSHDPAGNCEEFVHELSRHCKDQDHRPSKDKPRIAKAVSSIACVFAGYHAQRTDEEAEPFVRNNMSLENGVFTLHNGAKLGGFYIAGEVLRAGLDKLEGKGPAVNTATFRDNGAECNNGNVCGSGLCVHGTCKPCGGEFHCGAGQSCYEPMKWCRTPKEFEAQVHAQSQGDARHEANKEAHRGRSCRTGADCGGLTCSRRVCR